MVLKHLLKTNTWRPISSKFLELYPEAEKHINSYKTVFEKLLTMSPEDMDITIVLTRKKRWRRRIH